MSALTLEAHGGHDTPRLPRFDNAYDLVRLCGGKVRFHELVAPLLWVLQTLATRVNIRQVAAGLYTLALRKDGASWRTYRVIVEELK